jgi:hypothetical protein
VEFLSILAVLGRYRVLVAIGALVTVLAAVAAMGVQHKVEVTGSAESRVLIDTPRSLRVDLRPQSETVGAQATLIADLLSSDEQAAAIARAVGVSPDKVAVRIVSLATNTIPSPLAQRASEAAATAPQPYVLTVLAGDFDVPIITLTATGPTVRAAARLAEAGTSAVAVLTQTRAPSPKRALKSEPLGPVRTQEVVSAGRGKIIFVGGAIVLFVVWCCAIVVGAGVIRAWRGELAPAASL